MIETAARGVQFLLAIGIAYLIALWFALVAWTFRDIEARSRSVFTQVFSTLLVVLFFVPGLALYLILRPKETLDQAFQRALEEEYLLQDLDDLPLCQGCQRAVDPEFIICPHCQTHLRGPCPACARLIDLRWDVCPYCAITVDREAIPASAAVNGVNKLEESRAGRRKRAVAAAAQRVGSDGDELDALTDALSDSMSHAAVGAGNDRAGLTGRVPLLGDVSRLRSGARGKAAQSERAGATQPSEANLAPTEVQSTPRSESFWADPLPRPRGRGERPPTGTS